MALLDPDHVDELVQVYREHNDPQYSDLVCFDGVLDVLARLKAEGRRLGIVSAKRRPTVERVLLSAGMGEYFDAVVGSDDTERHKPEPEPILKALELLEAVPAEAAYVGDSPFDVAAARRLVYAVAVGWAASTESRMRMRSSRPGGSAWRPLRRPPASTSSASFKGLLVRVPRPRRSEVSDAEYDRLFDELLELERDLPDDGSARLADATRRPRRTSSRRSSTASRSARSTR
jgi:HAD superfamily hydrolase (TIGR01549 family)